MKMNKLTTLFLTATLTLASGSALAAAGAQSGATDSGDGQANAAAAAGQPAPDAHQNMLPKNTDSSQINTSPDGVGGGATSDSMTKDQQHKNTMCKDGRCPDINKQVDTNKEESKTDGTSQ